MFEDIINSLRAINNQKLIKQFCGDEESWDNGNRVSAPLP